MIRLSPSRPAAVFTWDGLGHQFKADLSMAEIVAGSGVAS